MSVQRAVHELLKKFPDAPARTLAKRLHDDNPALFPTIDGARSAVRYALGQLGTQNRRRPSSRKFRRAPRKAGELPPLPKSEAEEWEPFVLDGRRVLVVSDIHLPYHHVGAVNAALRYADGFKPDAIFINGDLFDFYAISRFDKDPTKPKISHELECGRQFFAHLRSRFGQVPITFKWGNHDERWDKYLQASAPLLFDIPDVRDAWHGPAGIREFGIDVVKDKRPVMAGLLPILHGHELGRGGISNPVNPARGAFLRGHHTILVGDSHQTSGHADTNLWHEETFCWSMGCLCGLTPLYMPVNRWNWGFACVEVATDGSFNVQNLRIAKNMQVRKS